MHSGSGKNRHELIHYYSHGAVSTQKSHALLYEGRQKLHTPSGILKTPLCSHSKTGSVCENLACFVSHLIASLGKDEPGLCTDTGEPFVISRGILWPRKVYKRERDVQVQTDTFLPGFVIEITFENYEGHTGGNADRGSEAQVPTSIKLEGPDVPCLGLKPNALELGRPRSNLFESISASRASPNPCSEARVDDIGAPVR